MAKKGKPGPKSKGGRPPIHACYSMIRSGKVPPEFRGIGRYLSRIRERILEDQGPDPTAAQMILADRAVQALGIITLIERHIKKRGLLEGDKFFAFLLHSIGEKYLLWDKKLIQTLQTLGIERKSIKPGALTIEALDALVMKEQEQESGSGSDQDPSGIGKEMDSRAFSEGESGQGGDSGGSPILGDSGAISDLDGIGRIEVIDGERDG